MKSEFRDIIPNEKKTIRNIPIPEGRRSIQTHTTEIKNTSTSKRKVAKEIPEVEEDVHFDDSFLKGESTGKKSNLSVWFFAILSVFVVMFVVTKILSSTTAEISLKKIALTADAVLSAEIKDTANEELHFSSMEFTNQASKTVQGTGEKEVSSKSTGTIIVYNNYNSANQILVAGTRFETASNLIFKTEKTVTVPGKKTVAGKTVPGSIEVKVVAEKAGTPYNIGPSDFTIPGFANGPKFNTIYGRSKNPMTGGNVGKIAVVDSKELAAVREELQKTLVTDTLSKARAEVPSDFILVNGAYSASFSTSDPVLDNSAAKITEKVQFKAYLFDKTELFIALAKSTKTETLKDQGTELDFSQLEISDISELGNKITFKIKGQLIGSYTINETKLKADLAGKNKKDVQSIFSNFKAIERAKITVKPFWVGKVSKYPEKIKIIKAN